MLFMPCPCLVSLCPEMLTFEVDYPVSLVAKRLHGEQEAFGLEAWSNFLETPPWGLQYIKQFSQYEIMKRTSSPSSSYTLYTKDLSH